MVEEVMKLTPEQLAMLRSLVLPHLAAAQNAEATARSLTMGFLTALGIDNDVNLNLDTGELLRQESKV